MSDDKRETGNPDRQRIAMGEDYEVRDWSKKFGVTLRNCSRPSTP